MARSREAAEQAQDDLNPHRAEELERAAAHTMDMLRQREIALDGSESPSELDDLLTAVQRFEQAVEARGGDLFVNMPDSTDPQRREFVVPTRDEGEPVTRYIARIQQAMVELSHRE
jgi:hypothetical protein